LVAALLVVKRALLAVVAAVLLVAIAIVENSGPRATTTAPYWTRVQMLWSVCAGGGVGCCVSRTLAADRRPQTADRMENGGARPEHDARRTTHGARLTAHGARSGVCCFGAVCCFATATYHLSLTTGPLPLMAGPATNLVQVFRTLRDLHWEFLRLWTGFELSSSCVDLP
jgi:hypothetical protein